MINFPSNNYPAIERPCAPYNETDFIETPSFTPSAIVQANYLSYPTAQGTEVFDTVKISQIADSVGSYGTDQQLLQGTVQSKIKWSTLANQTETFQTDVYRSSQQTGLFDITCPANTTRVDMYVIGQGGWASASGPKYKELIVQASGATFAYIYGPGTGAAGTLITLSSIPAQEGVCFRGLFTMDSAQYNTFSTQLYAVNGSNNVLIANALQGNWASDPNIGDAYYTPGNGYPGYARGPGTGAITNLTGSLLNIIAGDNGIDGDVKQFQYPINSPKPNPPFDQPASINTAVQFYDNGNKAYGTGGYFTDIFVDGPGPGYLHGTPNYPNDAAIVVVSQIDT